MTQPQFSNTKSKVLNGGPMRRSAPTKAFNFQHKISRPADQAYYVPHSRNYEGRGMVRPTEAIKLG